MGFKPQFEPLSVYSLSGCFLPLLCSSLDLSQLLSISPLSFQLSCPKPHGLFSSASLFLFLSPHLCSTPSFAPLFCFPLFFPSLSPGNQTSGEQCWVSTFPEKRTIWATQKPTIDPLCSLLPSLSLHSCTHIHRNIHYTDMYIIEYVHLLRVMCSVLLTTSFSFRLVCNFCCSPVFLP